MFNTVSMTGTGVAFVTVLNIVLPIFGFEVPEKSIEGFVYGIANIVGFGLLIYGQYRRGDMKNGIFRKSPVE